MKLTIYFILALAALGASTTAHASGIDTAPGTMAFVARLSSSGAPVTGVHDIQLDLFAADTGGATLWTEDHSGFSVPTDGVVFIDLGVLTPLDGTLLDGTARFLQITIDGTASDARVRVESAPYAIRAGVCGDADHLQSHPVSDLQLRLQGACGTGQSIQSINQDGSLTCETDQNTLFTAGAGLTLSAGNAFSADFTAVQKRVANTCSANQYITAIAADGSLTCGNDQSGTTFTAGAGLQLAGGVLTVDTGVVQHTLLTSCSAAGQAISAVDNAGSVTCVSEIANQNSSSQVASFSIAGTGRSNLVRTGTESGTTDAPGANLGGYDGVVHRRAESGTATAGNVVAKTDALSLQRDGSTGGMTLVFTALAAPASAECTLVAANGTASAVVKEMATGDAGPLALFADAAHVVFAHCVLGTVGHTTEVTLHRLGQGAAVWTGFLTSTLSQ
jgi:hypothetical protein|nr:hypothetical protein [Kofleriaceae bacterium]